MRYFAVATFLSLSISVLHAQMDGKQLYTINCSACHQLKIQQGGPALTEVAKLYRGKPEAFVKWAKNPLPHKRKNLAQMPAMAHVPDADLRKIYQHVMKVTKGLEAIKPKKRVDHFPDQLKKRPLIQRIFMPNVGPAAIAVALENNYNFAFDAGVSRLRFIWKGPYLYGYPYWSGNGDGLAVIHGKKVSIEETSPLPFITDAAPAEFLGYSMKDGLPTFKYRKDGIEVQERLTSNSKQVVRTFTLTGAPNPLKLNFPTMDGISYSSSHGQWAGTSLLADTDKPIVITYTFSK